MAILIYSYTLGIKTRRIISQGDAKKQVKLLCIIILYIIMCGVLELNLGLLLNLMTHHFAACIASQESMTVHYKR